MEYSATQVIEHRLVYWPGGVFRMTAIISGLACYRPDGNAAEREEFRVVVRARRVILGALTPPIA